SSTTKACRVLLSMEATMSNSSIAAPTADYTKEVRFAVVMYGGVSLAIYINGVAQELFRMIRSTAENVELDGIRMPLSGALDASPQAALKGTERVYRKLSFLLSDQDLLDECRELVDKPQLKGEKSELRKKLDSLIDNNEKPINTRFVVDILS